MTSPAQVQAQLTDYLQHTLGLGTNGIAGVEGNAVVESGLRTTAVNPREGAVGLFQWENGRRTNLRQFAAGQGLTETDPAAQIGFLGQELQGPYSSVLAQLRTAASPAQAAAIFDAQFERSAGTSRQARIDAANTIAAGGSVAGIGTGTGTGVPGGVQTVGASSSVLPGWLNSIGGALIPGWGMLAQATGLSALASKIGGWIVDAAVVAFGLTLIVVSFVLIAKGGDSGSSSGGGGQPAPASRPEPTDSEPAPERARRAETSGGGGVEGAAEGAAEAAA